MVEFKNQWRMLYRSYCLLVFCLLLPVLQANCQEVFENASPSMRWQQINTPHFKIIFPENFKENAQEVANRLEQIYEPAAKTLSEKPRRIPIILQNRQSQANGFVTLSPRRSEFYTMPPQDYNFLGTNTWLDLLSVHEYRHIVQFQQSLTGWSKILYYLFGQNAQAGMAVISTPRWFWEGDATLIETLLTPSGRGRIANFNRIYRTNLLEGENYKYVKQHLGSYKDVVPDHYVLGYHYVTHLRRRTNDPDIWEKVTHDSFSWPFIPFTFSRSLKRNTGKDINHNYRDMQLELKELWDRQQENLKTQEYIPLDPNDKVFTSYKYPALLGDNRIAVMKEGLGDVRHFVILDSTGREVDKFIPGIFYESGFLSTAGSRIVWNENFPDVRWGKESASVIKTYDFKTNEVSVLTKNTRYTGAAFSPDGKQIVTSLTTEDQQHSLVILDGVSGIALKSYSAPDNGYLSMAQFSNDGNFIISLLNSERGKAVVRFDVSHGDMDFLIPYGHENIGHPVLVDEVLFYNSPYNGIDNIYALNINTNARYQITNSQYGAYNPEVDVQNGLIYFNDYQVNGMNVASLPLDSTLWAPIEEVIVDKAYYFEPLLEQESMEALPDKDTIEYNVKPYRSFAHLLNIHSWGPIASSDINSAQLAIFSDDILRTTSLTAGYEYNINDRSGYWFADVSYQGLFPILDFRVEHGDRSSSRYMNGQVFDMTWKETTTQTGVRIPLNLTRSKFISNAEIGYNIGIRKINDFDNSLFDEDDPNRIDIDRIAPIYDVPTDEGQVDLAYFYNNEIDDGTLAFDNINASYYLLQKQSHRDLNSRWGFVLNYQTFNTRDFFNNDFNGGLQAFRGTLYLPSIAFLINNKWAKHHSFYVRINSQKRDNEFSTGLYYFANRIPMPRGYSYPNFEKSSSFSVNYKLPLLYPDINLGPLLYVKRVKLNLFYDYGQGSGKQYYLLYEPASLNSYYINTFSDQYKSIGSELTFDINVMRFPVDIDLGVRWTYTLDPKSSQFEFILLNIDF